MRGLLLAPALALAVVAAGCTGGGDRVDTPWSAPVALPRPAPPATAEAVERPDGSAIAVWAERRKAGSRYVLLSALRTPAGVWGPGVPVTPESPTPINGPRVVVDPRGAATAVWALWDRRSGAVRAFVQTARRRADGTWTAAETLSRGTNGLFTICAVAPAPGRVVVAWSGSDRVGAFVPEMRSAVRGVDGRWTLARLAGARWGTPEFTSVGLGRAGASGRVRLIWLALPLHGRPGGVLTATASPSGAWTLPRRLSEPGERAADLTASSASDGSMVATWRRRGRGDARITRAAGGGAWARAVTLPGGRVSAPPAAVAGDRGSALVALQRRRGARSTLETVAVRRDGEVGPRRLVDRRPVPRAMPPASPMPIDWRPALRLRPDGGALVVWARSHQRPDDVVVDDGVEARIAPGLGMAWGTRESIVALPAAVPGLAVAVDPPVAGLTQVRWTAGRGEASLAQTSTRTP